MQKETKELRMNQKSSDNSGANEDNNWNIIHFFNDGIFPRGRGARCSRS
jgi:hypothetical protein